MKKTVCLVSLGCPKNLVDSEVILGLLSKEGYLLTTDPSKAEIIIVNTCSFIQDATREAIETILRLAHYKQEGCCRLLIVSGCLPQRYGKILEKELPEVDLFVGTGAFQKLPQLLNRPPKKRSFLSGPTFLYDSKTPRIVSTLPSFAYIKIAEGCSKTCTFCTVPKIRGPYRSRRLRSVHRRGQKICRSRGPGTDSHCSGYHGLRRGSSRWDQFRKTSGKSCKNRRATLDPNPLFLP